MGKKKHNFSQGTASWLTMNWVQPPEPFSFGEPATWADWIKQYKLYHDAVGMSSKTEDQQMCLLLCVMGQEADEILSSLGMTEEKRTYDSVISTFDEYFTTKVTMQSETELEQKCNSNPTGGENSTKSGIQKLDPTSPNGGYKSTSFPTSQTGYCSSPFFRHSQHVIEEDKECKRSSFPSGDGYEICGDYFYINGQCYEGYNMAVKTHQNPSINSCDNQDVSQCNGPHVTGQTDSKQTYPVYFHETLSLPNPQESCCPPMTETTNIKHNTVTQGTQGSAEKETRHRPGEDLGSDKQSRKVYQDNEYLPYVYEKTRNSVSSASEMTSLENYQFSVSGHQSRKFLRKMCHLYNKK